MNHIPVLLHFYTYLFNGQFCIYLWDCLFYCPYLVLSPISHHVCLLNASLLFPEGNVLGFIHCHVMC